MRQRTKSAQFLLSKAFLSWTARVVAAPGGLEYHKCESFRLFLLSDLRTTFTRMGLCPSELRFDTQNKGGTALL